MFLILKEKFQLFTVECDLSCEPVIYGFKSILLGWATWFVVSLGVAQLIFASVLNATKNLKYIGLFLFLSVGIGIFIKSITSETLPYQLDKVFFVVFFFGMGFFYRIYELFLAKYSQLYEQ